MSIPPDERLALERGQHAEPHRILGVHEQESGGVTVRVLRAFHPLASSAACLLASGSELALEREGDAGVFSAVLPEGERDADYRLRFGFADGGEWSRADPYRFSPTLGDVDLHLLGEGRHERPWTCLGANPRSHEGVAGVAFAVWAPNARRVSLVGEFCTWDGRLLPMRKLGSSGIFELFVPELAAGCAYKYEVETQDGRLLLKADPYAAHAELPPATASRVFESHHRWSDEAWMKARRKRDIRREPLSVYEVHLGSFARNEDGNFLGYRELAERIADQATKLGFDHVELLPVAEHPFYGSWGYQVSSYYAPTSRHGDPDDFRAFVDLLHQRGLGVIVDWVPAHFVKDDFALLRFDGTALYEHGDPARGDHPDWGTAIFQLARHEVRNFLIGNALWLLEEMHVDGLRVDAVASMLYLDYSREEGEWTPNEQGGRENLEAVAFLRELNETVHARAPGCFTVAEESTSWPGVTAPVSKGGLGFTLKWNLGWMHDTLAYFSTDPLFRSHHREQLTFAMLYEHDERFLNPLSHDEVVHGKRSLLSRMPGDDWQRFANLRALFTYQWLRPGKQLLFMGSELAPELEWNHDEGLPWASAEEPRRAGLASFLSALSALYHESPCLYRSDPDPQGFAWIDCEDRERSILSFLRRHDGRHLICVLNLTPVPRDDYRLGVPGSSSYRLRLDSDELRFGGSGYSAQRERGELRSEKKGWQGQPRSLVLDLPPLSAVVLEPS